MLGVNRRSAAPARPSHVTVLMAGVMHLHNKNPRLSSRAPSPPILQRDNHVGNLTVSETLSFAHVCQSGQDTSSFDMQQHIREAKVGNSFNVVGK
jgi:hypothetical protein